MRFIRKLMYSVLVGDNWTVVTLIYKNWILSCFVSCEEFKYFCVVCVF